MFKKYYELAKPGIIYGNLLTATAGFLLGSKDHIHFGRLLSVLAGTALIIASACVINNYIDRGIDSKMARTKQRALVSGSISSKAALSYAAILGLLGVIVLVTLTNNLTLIVGLIAFVIYVALYGITKRRNQYGTIVGSLAGAAPILAGYTAATNQLNIEAGLIFLILVFWQMPHFYAIAIYRYDDYKRAKIPVLPVVKGFYTTKVQILGYVIAFIIASFALKALNYCGYSYLVVMAIVGGFWLYLALEGLNIKSSQDKAWARKMFLFSLVVILTTSTMLSVGPHLP